MRYPDHLQKLMENFKKLPGVGSKSAERFCFELLRWPEGKLKEFTELIEQLPYKLTHCEQCGALMEEASCLFCENQERNSDQLCLVATAKELFLIEETGQFHGKYHVLGGLLSPMRGIKASYFKVESLEKRIQDSHIKELILAFDSTLEGDATASYIQERFKHLSLHISRLAFGMPVGSLLEYADGSSLAQAFAYRRSL